MTVHQFYLTFYQAGDKIGYRVVDLMRQKMLDICCYKNLCLNYNCKMNECRHKITKEQIEIINNTKIECRLMGD